MSYLNILVRASQGPVTDYHLCLLGYPQQSNQIRSFYHSEEVLNIWDQMVQAEQMLLERERKSLVSLLSEDEYISNGLTSNSERQQHLTTIWRSLKDEYEEQKQLGLVAITSSSTADSNSSVVNATLEEEKSDKVAEAVPVTGKDFLLSIAGMFSSGYSRGSAEVEDVVAEAITRKYRHNADGGTS